MFSILSLIWPECHMKGSTRFPVNVPDIPDRRYPLASFTDKQVTTSYLACQPHLRHVVCMGGYSELCIPIHGPYCSTSYVVWDPTLMTTYPSFEQDIQVIIRIVILGELVLSQTSQVSQVVPSLVLVVTYPGVASYMREYKFPSHAQLLHCPSN
jgi:hypothetical protein